VRGDGRACAKYTAAVGAKNLLVVEVRRTYVYPITQTTASTAFVPAFWSSVCKGSRDCTLGTHYAE